MNPPGNQNPVIIFDGVCNLCNGAVAFIIKRDHSEKFSFAPIQSSAAKTLISKLNIPEDTFDSILLIENTEYYIKSTAALRICKKLSSIWPLVSVLIIIPRPIRDYFYDIVARNRYRWYGKREQCMIPNKKIESRFLD